MTYLFIVIGIAVINSLSNKSTSYAEVATINLILSSAILKERMICNRSSASGTNGNGNGSNGNKNGKSENKKDEAKPEKQPKYTVDYDNLELLGAQHRETLIADLRQRTGIDILRVQIDHIDLPKKKATLIVWANE